MRSIAKTRLEKTSNTMTPPRTSKEVKVKIFVKALEKGKILLTHPLINLLKMLKTKKKFLAKPHEKRSINHSQLRAMIQLADGVIRLTEVNARKMTIEEKEHKSLLKFQRQVAEKTQKQEKNMAELHSTNPNPFVHNQLSRSFISSSEFVPLMSSSASLFSPISRIGGLSNCFQP